MKKSLTRQRQISERTNDKEKKNNKFEQVNMRNMKCEVLPENITSVLGQIISLDVSHNKLNNSEIDFIFNHGKNIKYLQIQNNMSTIIPASIWKLTSLAHFRHDWVKVFAMPQQSNIKILQALSRKPEKIVKVQSILGINFAIYCEFVIKVPLSLKLKKSIEKSECSEFAKQQMLKLVSNTSINKQVKIAEKQGNFLMNNYPGCMMLLGFSETQKKTTNPIIKKDLLNNIQNSLDTSHQGKISIKINQIKNISSNNEDMTTTSAGNMSYFEPQLPLHNTFIHFDTLEKPQKQIQSLLINKNDPNIIDSKGLSIYHLCVIYNQVKGLKYIFELSYKFNGLFDLLINEKKQCRNIAHYAFFLKNLSILNILIKQGYPMQYRDGSGSRPIHLIDQNLQFLLQYRKIVKKNKNRYLKTMPIHAQRSKKLSKIIIVQKQNQKLLQQYENIVGLGSNQNFHKN